LTDSNSVTLRNILRHDSGIDGNVDSLYEAQLTNGSNCPKIQEGGYGGYSQSMAVRDLPSTTSIMSGSGKSTTERVRITYNNTSRRFTYSGPAFTTL
jgi:CubicO group peptidase (beta-lactamase class C family)